jgi:hypothetical protein
MHNAKRDNSVEWIRSINKSFVRRVKNAHLYIAIPSQIKVVQKSWKSVDHALMGKLVIGKIRLDKYAS